MKNFTATHSILQIPTILEDDLHAFRLFHFPGTAGPTKFFLGSDTTETLEEYEDDLGFYPDGVKRTLTDEQIAMFRHSEIQGILKERRHQEEMRSDSPDPGAKAEEAALNENASQGALSEGGHMPPPSERTRIRETKQGGARKRKRAAKDSGHKSEEEYTPRRIAREQDEQKPVQIDLDY